MTYRQNTIPAGGLSYHPDDLDDSSLDPLWTQKDYVDTPTSAGEGANGFEVVSGSSPYANGSQIVRKNMGSSGTLIAYLDFVTSNNSASILLRFGTGLVANTWDYRISLSRESGAWKSKTMFWDGTVEQQVSGGNITVVGQNSMWVMLQWSRTHMAAWYNLGAEASEPPLTNWVLHGSEILRVPLLQFNGDLEEGVGALTWGSSINTMRMRKFRRYY